jgi:hypothetical protein
LVSAGLGVASCVAFALFAAAALRIGLEVRFLSGMERTVAGMEVGIETARSEVFFTFDLAGTEGDLVALFVGFAVVPEASSGIDWLAVGPNTPRAPLDT